MSAANLAAMHRQASERLGSRTALRFKRNGVYHDVSWSDYREQADRAAAGLISLGIQPGDRIALLSENRFEWMLADQAILSTGAVNVPLHAPLTPKQVEYQVGHSESRGIIVSNQTQADKLAAVRDALPDLEFLIAFDPITPPAGLRVLSWDALKQRGRLAGSDRREEIRRREAALTGDDLATIIYTSGTTGNPKGVMLTHDNLHSNALATAESCHNGPSDILLSWLPYSHIYARTVDLYVTTVVGMTVVLAESVDTLVANLQEAQPTWLTAVPRFYEKVWANVEHLPPESRKQALHQIFGSRLRQLSSGGAPLPRHIAQGFQDAGIPLLEGYGLTESSPVISFNNLDHWRVGTVGRALPGVEIRIAEDGEILTRGPHVMKGYWKNPEATAEAIVDGWLHTGDVGEIDADGYLTITDRKKDLIVTSGGKNVAPSELERLLVSDPYIDQAVLYGDGRPFVTALLVPNFAQLEQKVEELGCRLESEGEFLRTPDVLAFYQQRIDAVMEPVSRPERVKRFLLLGRPFELAADELTATLKVRRRHIIRKYEAELAALYSGNGAPSDA